MNHGKMKILCNFTCDEFINIYSLVSTKLEEAHRGGRQSYYSPQTIFLITLCFLKTAMQYTSIYFGILIDKTIDACAPILTNHAIRWISMAENIQKNALFRFFPSCICAVDGSVQRIPRPTTDQKSYYSGKHKFHCLKMQVAVGPQGLAVDIQGPFKGSVNDFTIFKNTRTRFRILAERSRYVLNNPQTNLSPIAAIFDKGYIGVNNIVSNSITPIKKLRNNNYTFRQQDYNEKVSFDRIIVERWFGRLKTLWGIMFVPFQLKQSKYQKYYMICAALTNMHIMNHPLTANDPVDPELVEDD